MNNKIKLIAAVVLGVLPWIAAAQTFKLATAAPDGTGWMREMRAAGDRIGDRSEGRIKIKFYPGGVMGNPETVLRKMRVGQLQGGAFTSGDLVSRNADYLLYTTPFLFRDEAEIDHVRERLDPLVMAATRRQGLEVLAMSGGGFVHLFSDHPVISSEQLARSKVWTPEGDPVAEWALRKAGVAPVPLTLPDVYTALQTGVIDTALNTTAGVIAFQWHTKMKYMTDLPIAYVVGVLALDTRAFGRLNDDFQSIVREEFEVAFERIEQLNRKDVIEARAALANQGIEILQIPAETQATWKRLGEQVLEYMGSTDDFELQYLDEMIAVLRQYRQVAGARD